MHYEQIHTAPDVFLIRVPFDNYKLDSTNCYVVRDGGDVLVVDTGAPFAGSEAFLRAALAELGIQPEQARYFLTHLHLDHAGLIDPLAAESTVIYLSKRDYDRSLPDEVVRRFGILHDKLVAEGAESEMVSRCIEARTRYTHIIQQPHDLQFVAGGSSITMGRYTFQVIDTSGHTPGHLGLFEPESGILFSGDHVLFTISPSMGFFLNEKDSVQIYLDNLDKVQQLGITHLFHSHGELRGDFAERIEWLGDHQRQRASRVRQLVEANPGVTGFQITQMIGFNVPHKRWDDIACVQRLTLMEIGAAFLRHLVQQRKVEMRPDANGIRHYYSAS